MNAQVSPQREPIVNIVDDDLDVLKALDRLFRSSGLRAATYASAAAFLAQLDVDAPGCLVLDLSMPGQDGLSLQHELSARGVALPIVFLTGHGDVPTSVSAMKHGALDFLQKPVNDVTLLDAVHAAFARSRTALEAQRRRGDFVARLQTLTPREREVLPHILAGRLNKQIAYELGTVEKTIKVHRSRLMHKLGTRSVAELARLAEVAGVEPTEIPI